MSTLVFQNPFSTRFVQPGAIPWFAADTSLSTLLFRLYDVGNRAIICGPHGSGKSTILSHLASVAQRQGLKVHCLRICSWIDAIRVMRVFATMNPKQSIVSVDSWELLGFFWVVSVPVCRLPWYLCGCGLSTRNHGGIIGLYFCIRKQMTKHFNG